jgi:predicted transcriptional regulator
MVTYVSEIDYLIYMELYKRTGPVSIEELSRVLGIDQSRIHAFCLERLEKNDGHSSGYKK